VTPGLARASWVREMALRLERLVSMTIAAATLSPSLARSRRSPTQRVHEGSGRLASSGTKVAAGLVERDFALVNIDVNDSRRKNIELTAGGREYALNVIEVIHTSMTS